MLLMERGGASGVQGRRPATTGRRFPGWAAWAFHRFTSVRQEVALAVLRSAALVMMKSTISCSIQRADALREVPNLSGFGRIPSATMPSVADRFSPSMSQTTSIGMSRIGNCLLVVFLTADALSGDRAHPFDEDSNLSSWSRFSARFLLPMIATWNALISTFPSWQIDYLQLFCKLILRLFGMVGPELRFLGVWEGTLWDRADKRLCFLQYSEKSARLACRNRPRTIL